MRTTLDTVAGLEKHEPSGMFYNWYDAGDRRRSSPTSRTSGDPIKPFLSSVDNGWLATGLLLAAPRRAGARRRGRRDPRSQMDFGCYYNPDGQPDPRRLLGRGPAASPHRWPATTAAWAQRRLVHRPPLRRVQHRAADGVLPRHRRGADPAEALLRHVPHLPRQACDWAWTETQPIGEWREYLGVRVFEGALPYRGMQVVPTWGGSMFEALMVPLFVPEEKWGPRSWGDQPPALRARPDRARHDRGRLRLLGLLARRTTRPAATASTASTCSASTVRATPPTRSAPTGTSRTRAAARASLRPRRVRRRRRHAARLVPGAALRAAGRRWPTCSGSRGRLRRLRARAASTTPSPSAADRSASATCRWTRA